MTLDLRGIFITLLNTQEGTFYNNSPQLNITAKILHPWSEQGPKSAPKITPDRTQIEHTQVAQKTSTKKQQLKSI